MDELNYAVHLLLTQDKFNTLNGTVPWMINDDSIHEALMVVFRVLRQYNELQPDVLKRLARHEQWTGC